jgi:UDPglucose 6-dehydrogenase
MNQKERISVIGLGKLGSTMLACFAHKKWEVIGVDVNQNFVDTINKGHSPIYEPRVEELINLNDKRIEATVETEFAVLHSDISFIIVPTPSVEEGFFSIKYVEAVALEIAKALKQKNSFHVIVITSTVLPGDTARITDMIVKESGKTLGKDFGVCYNPDFIALGKIVHDFLNPDMILIGESDEKSGAIVEDIHTRLIDNNPPIFRTNPHNAELSKISLNAYCTLKITFANSIAEICEKMPGGDSEVVLQVVGSDTRVGHKFFRGGLGFGGPCFPRDNRALSYIAKGYGVTEVFCDTTDEINEYHKTERISNLLMELLKERNVDDIDCQQSTGIAILGLSYKEDTPVVEESVSMAVIKTLSKKGIKLSLYDPAAMDSIEDELTSMNKSGKLPHLFNITFATSEYECVKGKSVCFIATPWRQFRELEAQKLLEAMEENSVILDAWRMLPFERASTKDEKKVIEVRKIGKNL